MKDKRQRFVIPWPYSGLYADPTFAASLLQVTTNSFGMPYGYAGNPMIPQMPVLPTTQMPMTVPSFMDHMYYSHAPYILPQQSSGYIQKFENDCTETSTKVKSGHSNLFKPYALPTLAR